MPDQDNRSLTGTTDEESFAAAMLTAPVLAPSPLSGPRWPGSTLTWSFAERNYAAQPNGASFSGFITDPAMQSLVRKAAILWSSISGVTLTESRDSGTTNIRIGLQRLNPASTSTLGLTSWSATAGTIKSAVIGLEDTAQLGVTATADGDLVYNGYTSRVFQLIVHEFGHALGLAHNTLDPQSVMYETATAANRSIDINDSAGIRTLFGGSAAAVAAVTVGNTGAVRVTVRNNATINPFANVTVRGGTSLTETVRVTVSGGGTLRDPLAGTDAAFSGGVFTETVVNLAPQDGAEAMLRRLVYTPPAGIGTANFQIEVGNSLQGTGSYAAINADYGPITTPPSITGLADLAVTDQLPVSVFQSLTIADADPAQMQTVTVTMSVPKNGSFSNLGAGTYTAATGTYAVTGTAAQVTAALARLVFTPAPHLVPAGGTVLTTFTISDVNAAGASSSAIEAVVATATGPAVPVFAIAPLSADKPEGNGGSTPFTFTITRSGATTATQSIPYSVNGTGANPANTTDFGTLLLPSGSVTFYAGETAKIITVNVAGDTTNEPDETFAVTIYAPSDSTASVESATGTIRNDDAAAVPGPSFAIGALSADKPEGNTGNTPFTFNVVRSGDTTGVQSIPYTVAGSGPAPADAADFGGAFPSGTLAFNPGETTKTITLLVAGDTAYEQDESFGVTLGMPSAGTVGSGAAFGTIRNDELGLTCGVVDGTTGKASVVYMDGVSPGGPSYLQAQYIYAGDHDLAIATQAVSVFIHSGSGNDAIQAYAGQNVLDGGLGSNFMTGGTGSDTFFTDARAPGVVWNTIRNFHQGSAATLWGFTAGVSSYRWEPGIVGAPGSEGATLRANIVGGGGRAGDGIDASITFAGLSVDQAQKLQLVTGTQPAGNYLFLYNPGV